MRLGVLLKSRAQSFSTSAASAASVSHRQPRQHVRIKLSLCPIHHHLTKGLRSLLRRVALKALLSQPARRTTALSSIASSRVTRLPSTTPTLLRSFHQIRASWAESDSQTPQEQESSEAVDVPAPVETREPVEINEASASTREDDAKRTIYAGNLFFETSETDLTELFSDHGSVLSARIVRDRAGRSKGFAFIKMETEAQADAAIKTLHEHIFQGRRLMAAKANGSQNTQLIRKTRDRAEPSEPTNTLFVGNMPRQMTDRDLNGKCAAHLKSAQAVLG